jgi:NifU-like protein involved in Fe-S cluster formation
VEGGRISEVRFKAKGCVTAVACGSSLTETLAGRSMTEAGAITPEQIAEELGGLPPATMHAAQLAVDALRELLRNRE